MCDLIYSENQTLRNTYIRGTKLHKMSLTDFISALIFVNVYISADKM